MRLSQDDVIGVWKMDRQKDRKLMGISICVTVFLFVLSLSLRTRKASFVPKEAYTNLYYAAKFEIAHLFRQPFYLERTSIIKSLPYYWETLARLRQTFITCVSGMALSLAGGLFQMIYRNPLASPNMLGATVGVNLGNVIMVVLYSGSAFYMTLERYKLCYLITCVILVLVLALGKFAGGKGHGYSVIEMVMAGSVISQMCRAVITHLLYNMYEEDLLVYEQLNLGTYAQTGFYSMLVFSIAMCVSILPMVLLRYRFNVAGVDPIDAMTTGVNPKLYRFCGQVCGAVMLTTAFIHCGDIGMLSMAMPHLVRYLVGANFKRVLGFGMLFGACLLMISRIISAMFYVKGMELPIPIILCLCIMPVYLVVLAKNRRGFE